MSRPSQTESAYVQTIVRSKLLVRSSCVQSRICPDDPRPKAYMSRLSYVLVQIILRSKLNSCVPTPKFWCVHVQTIVRSCPDFRAFTRLRKNTSCGSVLFFEDEGGRGFLKFDYFHRVNLLFKLNQI